MTSRRKQLYAASANRRFEYRCPSTFAVLLFLGVVPAGCGGSAPSHGSSSEYTQAAVVTGIAVTAALIQAARKNAKPVKAKDVCCKICDRCSFPCGDTCITIGNICFKPDGCACYDSQLPQGQYSPDPGTPCAEPPGQNDDTLMVPYGGSF